MRLARIAIFAFSMAMMLGALMPAAAPSFAAERVALVLGNGDYRNANKLPNPARDAKAVADKLRKIGFEVVEGIDLDRRGMEISVRDFLREADGSKIALMFYAGHGLQVDGHNYLVPVDATLESASDLSFETIDLDVILSNLKDPGRANIIILDACRDNPLARSFSPRGATRSFAVGKGLAAYSTVGTGTLIAFATAPQEVALDGQGEHSPFTAALLQHIDTPALEIRQMLTRVRSDVAQATDRQQVPWDNSSLLGDVYLAGPPAAGTPFGPGSQTAIKEVEALRKQAAEQLEQARRAAEAVAEEAKRLRSASLLGRNDPTKGRKPQFGALAMSQTSFAWGSGYEFDTREEAEKRALLECSKHAGDCRIIQWGRDNCLALSFGTDGFGHADGADAEAARKAALSQCGQFTDQCVIRTTVCMASQ